MNVSREGFIEVEGIGATAVHQDWILVDALAGVGRWPPQHS